MRKLLGILLALNGAAIWALTAVVTLMSGMAFATTANRWVELPLYWKLAVFPLIYLLLGIGFLMTVFGVSMDPSSRFEAPESRQVEWFALIVLRQTAAVLILPFGSSFFIHLLARTEQTQGIAIGSAVIAAALGTSVYLLSRVIDRFP